MQDRLLGTEFQQQKHTSVKSKVGCKRIEIKINLFHGIGERMAGVLIEAFDSRPVYEIE